ncbi:hypothetical protein HY01_0124 [Escherichia phage HY01]|uniref:Uncharacterized protein n=2 Tax=Tequatrovirus hy01 TaxID=2049937 RepID=A0A0A0PZH7_9CAUD|nr:hypothetical protein ACQ54_gp124 [Escherichia phage HY01]AHK10981.1 hypothetical protein HY01_0124 [Escherichia phage HY01]AKN44491.1 hypothetical protein PEC04_0004 [Escherichia phage PEC04]
MSLYTELNETSEKSFDGILSIMQKQVLEQLSEAASNGHKACRIPSPHRRLYERPLINWLESEGLTVKICPAKFDVPRILNIYWDKPIEKSEPWVVNVKTYDNGCSLEVSAVIKGTHGEKSWGWPGKDKEIVLSVKATSISTPIAKSIIAAVEEAERICKIKNSLHLLNSMI